MSKSPAEPQGASGSLGKEIDLRTSYETRIEQLNRTLRTVANVSQAIAEESERAPLADRVCACLTAGLGSEHAWLVLFAEDGAAELAVQSAKKEEARRLLREAFRDGAEMPPCVATAAKTAEPVSFSDHEAMCEDCPLRGLYRGTGGLTVRIASEGRVQGVFGVAVEETAVGDPDIRSLFSELANDLGAAFDRIALREERGRLLRSNDRYARLVASATEGMALIDNQYRYLIANERLAQLYGRRATDFLGRTVEEIVGAEFFQRVCKRHLDRALQGETIACETVREEGGAVDLSLLYFPCHDDRSGIQAVGVCVRDITPRKRAERALRDATLRLRESVRAANIGLWDWDLASNTVRYSPEWKGQIGYEDHEISDSFEEWNSRVHPDDLPRTLRRIREAIDERRRHYNVEFRFRHKDGSYRWVLAQAAVISDEDGQPARVVGSHIDITERKQAEEQIRQSREKLELALRGGGLGAWDWDIRTGGMQFSERWARMRGYDPEEIEPTLESWKECVHPDDLPGVLALLNAHLDGKTAAYEAEFRMKHKSGRWLWILDRGRVVEWDDRGRPLRACGTNLDITARKEMEQALYDQQVELDQIFEALPDAVAYSDPQRRIQRVNSSFTRMLGYNPEDVIGKSAEILYANPAEFIEQGRLRFRPDAGGSQAPFEVEYRRKDGSTFPGETVGTIVRDSHGEAVGYLGLVRDITERKRAEQEQAGLREQLAQSRKLESVGRLAGGVAHDFNNLIMGIMGYVDMCLDELDETSPLRGWLNEIMNEARRSAGLTRQLLAFARKQTVAPRVLDLNETVAGTLKMLGRLIGEEIDLAWMPCGETWPIKIDPGQIDQILVNACVNARDAMGGAGRISIETSNVAIDATYAARHADAEPGHYVELAISDDGCGMDAETREHAFEPFYTTKALGHGTGLGLATVYGIAKQNGGFIGLYSELGHGTTIRVYFPRCHSAVSAPDEAEEESPTLEGSESLLLAEDEAAVRVTTALYLRSLGYDVIDAGSPEGALDAAREGGTSLDLLITDVVMPGMDGKQLAERLRESHPELKVLFMSGYTSNVIAHRGVLDEGVEFLSKPIARQDLAARIRRILDR
jgi:two-component system, cell cycle sensor histidine kinase and response regulator CckA